ncbi:MAG TPA: helicase C-terminal domain-containing protein, partial [Acidothermaceae bacterium]
MSTAQADLVSWLRAQSDDDLVRLLAARPDLLHPVPFDIGVLAARAGGHASVEIALDRLDIGALQVIEGLTLSADPTNLSSLATLLDVVPERIAATVERLRQAALVWGSDDALRLLPAVRDLMHSPAELGPPARALLENVPRSRLATLLRDLGLPDVGDPSLDASAALAAVDSLASFIEDSDQLAALLERVPAPAREVIDLLAAGPPAGRVPAARRPVDAATADSPVRWLLAHALLVAVDDFTVVLPREIAIHLRGGHAFRALELDPPQGESAVHSPADVDAAAAGQAFTFVRLVEALLERWGVDAPGVLRAGGLGVRELRRTARELDVEERVAAVLIEVSHAAGLIAPDGESASSWLPTTGYDVWLARSVADRWTLLATAWLATTRVPGLVGQRDQGRLSMAPSTPPPTLPSTPSEGVERPTSGANALGGDIDRALAPIVRREMLAILSQAPVGSAPTMSSIAESLRWRWPRRGGRLRDDLVAWSHDEAELLGLTGRGALSSFGRILCADASPTDTSAADSQPAEPAPDPAVQAAVALAALLPQPLDHVLLQADLTAVAPGPLESELARELGLAADIESTGGATVFRFTDASIRRALDAGRSASDLHALLTARSRTPVPQPLSYLIDDVARRHGRIRIGVAGAYVRCDDDAVLSEVLADRRVESLRLRRLAPSVLVSPLAPERVAERLREVGYAPAAESPDGALLLRRPDARRAPSRPRQLRRRPELAASAGSVVTLAVKAIRGGDRAVTAARGLVVGGSPSDVLPHSASSETLSVLQDALTSGRAVWIGYLNAQGQATNRIVEPQRLSGGYLTAFDYRRDEPRTFAIHRITGVAELTDVVAELDAELDGPPA